MKTVRAKFRCDQLVQSPVHNDPDRQEEICDKVILTAVTNNNENNEDWSRYTPHGQLEMTVTNKECEGFFKPGREYFIDFQKVEISEE